MQDFSGSHPQRDKRTSNFFRLGEKMKFITVQEAADQLQITRQAIHQAMWRKVLKCKRNGRRVWTTQEWLEEYLAHWRSKQEHSMFNGEKVFNKEKGHYSAIMAGEYLGVKPQLIYDMVKEGKLKHLKKGYFTVIQKEELDRMKDIVVERHHKSA